MSCPDCKSNNTSISEIFYEVVEYNPTVPYVDNVKECKCLDCNSVWFKVIQ
jgi:hypothetical protein